MGHNIVRKTDPSALAQWRSFVKIKMTVFMVIAALASSSCIFTAKYSVGGTLVGLAVGSTGIVLQNNSGDSLTLTGNGTFTFSEGVTNDNAYSVTVSTQPTEPVEQTCTVRNGTGTIDKAAVSNVIVICTQPGQFAYVANGVANDISAYVIDPTNGELTDVAGSPFAASGTTPTALVVDPNGAYLYGANNTTNTVTAYAIDPTTGELTASGLGSATGSEPAAVAMDPAGHYLFVANFGDNTVSVFSVGASAALTAVTGSPFQVGEGPSSLQVDPFGNYLYVANFSSADISVFGIDAATGTLTAISGSPFGAGTDPISIAIDPTVAFAYVANEGGADI